MRYDNPRAYDAEWPYDGQLGIYTEPALQRRYLLLAGKGTPTDQPVALPWGELLAANPLAAINWRRGRATQLHTKAPWLKANPSQASIRTPWHRGTPKRLAPIIKWAAVFVADGAHSALPWGQAQALATKVVQAPWLGTHALRTLQQAAWLMMSDRHIVPTYDNGLAYDAPWSYEPRTNRLTLNQTTQAKWGGYAPHDTQSVLPWGGGFIVWGTTTPIEWTSNTDPLPDHQPPPDPIIAEFYNIMATDLTVTDVANGTPLDITDVTMSLDIDSFAWRLNARVLNQASMTLCQPPAAIKIATMGWEWVFVIESYTKQRDSKTTWQIAGSSLSRQLDAPWADADTHREAEPTTLKQSVESLLPIGWVAAWDKVTDFTIPAGAWSYESKTPLAAITELLASIGAVIVPDLGEQVLHIQPRYKYAPWEYHAVTTEPDAIVHEAMIISESGQYRPAQQHNGVWVSGNTTAGVIVEVTRNGTDGAPTAPDAYHDLIVDSVTGAQKGKQIIAASGSKTLVTIETIITDEQASPGLIMPGQLVEVQSAGETWRGVCLSCAVSKPGSPRITQTITVERDHGDYS